MRFRSKRGTTLAEALVALSLFALVLGISARIASVYSRLAQQGRIRQALVDSARTGLTTVAQEVRDSTSIVSLGSVLRLEKIMDQIPGRLPNTFPTPAPAVAPPVELHPPSQLFDVRYQLEGDCHLWREISGPIPTQRQRVCSDVYGFNSRLTPQGTIEVAMSINLEGRTERLQVEVYRPMP